MKPNNREQETSEEPETIELPNNESSEHFPDETKSASPMPTLDVDNIEE